MELFRVYVEEASGISYYYGGKYNIIASRIAAQEAAKEALNKAAGARVAIETAYVEFEEETVFC